MGVLLLYRLKPGGEMAHQRRLIGESIATQFLTTLGHLLQNMDHISKMALRVHPAGDGQPHQLQLRVDHLAAVRVGEGEHDRADLTGADAAFEVQGDRQRLPGELALRDVRQQLAGVQVDGVSAGRLDDRDALFDQPVADEGGLLEAVAQVALVQAFIQTGGHRVQVAPGQPAVGGEALAQDQLVLDVLEEILVAHGQEAADVDQGVFLGAHPGAVGQAEHLAGDIEHGGVRIASFPLVDEVGVLGEPAAVDEEGDLEFVVDLRHRADVGHRDRLSAAGVVGDGDRAKGDVLGPGLLDEGLQLLDVHVALEGMVTFRVEGVVDHQVGGTSAAGADVGVGGVEVHVRGDIVAGLYQ